MEQLFLIFDQLFNFSFSFYFFFFFFDFPKSKCSDKCNPINKTRKALSFHLYSTYDGSLVFLFRFYSLLCHFHCICSPFICLIYCHIMINKGKYHYRLNWEKNVDLKTKSTLNSTLHTESVQIVQVVVRLSNQ